jgi:cell division septal protein FtsQ
MSPVAAVNADKRFRRAQVKPAHKRRTWRAVVTPILVYAGATCALAYVLFRTTVIVAHAHVLQVDRIVVHGNERLSKGDVLAVMSGLRGESLLWTDLDRWRKRLLASAWVQDAALRRSLPSTIDIVISERRAVAIGRINGDTFLIDERGVIIDQYGPQYADLDLPIVDGLSAAPSETGTLTDAARADLAARVIAALKSKPAIAKRLSQIDVTDVHNATVILSGDTAAIQLGEDQFLPRLDSYLQMAAAVRDQVPDIDSVDLRFDDRIYVRPTPKSKRRK